MKISHIIGIIAIAVAIGVVISSMGNTSKYVSFGEAIKIATENKDTDVHVVGHLKKDKKGNILEMNYNPVIDANLFTFTLIDEKGTAKPVVYFDAKPQDFERSEKVVVVGNMKNEQFIAKKILMKCPSKYQDGKFREAEKAVASAITN